ncbi:MAG: hypothetical protein P1U85_21240 [Verrucomicrobiales bacterium]|nr:hypothetical protein [Verrucomicrobiales bacterium]
MSNLLYVQDQNNHYRPAQANNNGVLQVEISNASVNCSSTITNNPLNVSFSTTTNGSQGNLFNASSVADGGSSSIVDISSASLITVLGNTSDSVGNIMIQESEDNTNFYTSHHLYPDYNGDFYYSHHSASKHLKLVSAQGQNTTITASVLFQ